MLKGIKSKEYQIKFKALLYSGLRYIEAQRLFDNPDWFDGNFIKLPSIKKKARQRERWVRLNPVGKATVEHFLTLKTDLPNRGTWAENLERWSRNVNLSSKGLCPKTNRKTWESWLLYYYPQYQVHIAQSQGHTNLVQFEHYINMPFLEQDKIEMRPFVEGWI